MKEITEVSITYVNEEDINEYDKLINKKGLTEKEEDRLSEIAWNDEIIINDRNRMSGSIAVEISVKESNVKKGKRKIRY